MSRPRTSTASASGFSRLPEQAAQTVFGGPFLDPGQLLSLRFRRQAVDPGADSPEAAAAALSAPEPLEGFRRPGTRRLLGIDLAALAEPHHLAAQPVVSEVVPQGGEGLVDRFGPQQQVGPGAAAGPESAAFPAGPLGAVEGEEGRSHRLEGAPARGTGGADREAIRLLSRLPQRYASFARIDRGLERTPQASHGLRLDDQPVDDDVHRLPGGDGRGELLRVDLLENGGLPAQPQPRVPGFFHLLQQVVVPMPKPERKRRQDDETRAFRQSGGGFEQLLGALRVHRGAAPQAVGVADLGKERADVVVETCRGRRGRAGVASPGARLVRGQSRGKPVDAGDPGPAQPGGCRASGPPGCERGEEAPARLGIEGVEHQRGFPRARDPADRHELPVRQVDVDFAEVVLRGPADGDRAVHLITLSGRDGPAQTGDRGRAPEIPACQVPFINRLHQE